MIKKSNINLDDFKKWIEGDLNLNYNINADQEDQQDDYDVNEVVTKISLKKIHLKAEVDEGYAEEVCLDFYKNGGTIIDVVDDTFLIEVESGTLYLKKIYVEEK